MARPERFELPTYSSGGCRSIQLSYGRATSSLHPHFGAIKCGRQSEGLGREQTNWVQPAELPTTASATTAALPATATTTAAAPAAFRFGARFVHVQGSSADLRSVQSSDCLLSIFRACHLDKSETPRASRVAVGQDADAIDLAVGLEELTQFVFCRIEIQVSHKDVLQASALGGELFDCGRLRQGSRWHLSLPGTEPGVTNSQMREEV